MQGARQLHIKIFLQNTLQQHIHDITGQTPVRHIQAKQCNIGREQPVVHQQTTSSIERRGMHAMTLPSPRMVAHPLGQGFVQCQAPPARPVHSCAQLHRMPSSCAPPNPCPRGVGGRYAPCHWTLAIKTGLLRCTTHTDTDTVHQ